MAFEAIVVRLCMADLARETVAMVVVYCKGTRSWCRIFVAVKTGGKFWIVPHGIVCSACAVEIRYIMAIVASHASIEVHIPGKPNCSHVFAGIALSVAPVASLVHRWFTEERVPVEQSASIPAGTAYMAFSACCMAVHTVQVEHFSKPFMGIVQGCRVGKIDQGICKSTYSEMQGVLVGFCNFRVTL